MSSKPSAAKRAAAAKSAGKVVGATGSASATLPVKRTSITMVGNVTLSCDDVVAFEQDYRERRPAPGDDWFCKKHKDQTVVRMVARSK